jgi:hypothetical protein
MRGTRHPQASVLIAESARAKRVARVTVIVRMRVGDLVFGYIPPGALSPRPSTRRRPARPVSAAP